MTKTRVQLVNRTLFKLGALPAGQSADAEDYQTVNDTIEAVLSNLATRNIWQWGDPNEIDDDAFEDLTDILADVNASLGGKAQSAQARAIAESRLRLLGSVLLSGQPQRAEYF